MMKSSSKRHICTFPSDIQHITLWRLLFWNFTKTTLSRCLSEFYTFLSQSKDRSSP